MAARSLAHPRGPRLCRLHRCDIDRHRRAATRQCRGTECDPRCGPGQDRVLRRRSRADGAIPRLASSGRRFGEVWHPAFDLTAHRNRRVELTQNPDAAELVRGKAGDLTGNLMHLMMVMKGLPLTYNKDQQDDKEHSQQI